VQSSSGVGVGVADGCGVEVTVGLGSVVGEMDGSLVLVAGSVAAGWGDGEAASDAMAVWVSATIVATGSPEGAGAGLQPARTNTASPRTRRNGRGYPGFMVILLVKWFVKVVPSGFPGSACRLGSSPKGRSASPLGKFKTSILYARFHLEGNWAGFLPSLALREFL
jgi:hypothetical protein